MSSQVKELRRMASEANEDKAKQDQAEKMKFTDVSVEQGDTTKIVLPNGMSHKEAVKWIRRDEDQQSQEVAIRVEIEAAPLDGAYALKRVLTRVFGWPNMVSVPGGFFQPDRPPVMIEMDIAPNKTAQVHWGRITIPGVTGYLETGYAQHGRRCNFQIEGVVQRKHEKLLKGIAEMVREEVRTGSVYKGQALIVSFRDDDGNLKEFNPGDCPKFMRVDDIDERSVVLPHITADLVQTTLFNVIEKTDLCRRMGTPTKRGILLEGPPGTGKTLIAKLTALKCVQNGWTYIYCKDVRDLDSAIELGKQYQPCVLFAEDLDRAVGRERTVEVDRYLNVLDGVDSKSHEIIVVLTTNHQESITEAMKRPGRIDTIVPVRAPDKEAAARLIMLYGRGMVRGTLDTLGDALAPLVNEQVNAAMFREVVERAKLAAIKNYDNGADLGDIFLEPADIAIAAEGMKAHNAYSKPQITNEQRPMGVFGEAVGRSIGKEIAKCLPSDVK